MLPWFKDKFPIYLAPMAGVTDVTFRTLCKELGADVMVTEFVSAEGIIQADHRTRKYTTFTDEQRPVGVQLFGADGDRMGEAAKKIIDWKQPDFIDLNFGCPVNKVVSRNGGSSLLKDCPLLTDTADENSQSNRRTSPCHRKNKNRLGPEVYQCSSRLSSTRRLRYSGNCNSRSHPFAGISWRG
jgi:tRNA-dihydrouridine synthase